MKKYIFNAIVATILALTASVSYASHSWGVYHWARTTNPFTLKLGDAVNTSAWDFSLRQASNDWSLSSVLDTSVVSSVVNPKTCKPTNGRVEVCNSKYGNNGWLGIAQIWITGGEHITQGAVKLNDTYFNTSKYNKSEWRNLVVCQEIGHTFGLDHQDEIFGNANIGTCMDYTNLPLANQHPNQHDYDELLTIYSHLDSINTVFNSTASIRARDVDVDEISGWGRAIGKDKQGRDSKFIRNVGKGVDVVTHVFWAE